MRLPRRLSRARGAASPSLKAALAHRPPDLGAASLRAVLRHRKAAASSRAPWAPRLGVAGGVLLADSIRGLMGGHNNSLGIADGLGGSSGSRETVVNNYYNNDDASTRAQDAQQDADQDQDDIQDAGDYSDDYSSDA